MAAQVFDLAGRRPFVASEPDGDDPNDFTPRTDRERRIAELNRLSGFREGLAASAEDRQKATELADMEQQIALRASGRHLQPVS